MSWNEPIFDELRRCRSAEATKHYCYSVGSQPPSQTGVSHISLKVIMNALIGIISTLYLAGKFWVFVQHPETAPSEFTAGALWAVEFLGIFAIAGLPARLDGKSWFAPMNPDDLTGREYADMAQEQKTAFLSVVRGIITFFSLPTLLFITLSGLSIILIFTGNWQWALLFLFSTVKTFFGIKSKNPNALAYSAYVLFLTLLVSKIIDENILPPASNLSTLLLWGAIYYSLIALQQIWFAVRSRRVSR